ncbi:copper transporter 4 [Carica papaya]|uniref:copper transporter 4 n=1 Tax=Carica papaya TaxID=3649 RepID=UPI000B8CD918|nr:copper transporter 4 [Carica papaya]
MLTLDDAVLAAMTSAWNTTGGSVTHVAHRPLWMHLTFYWGHTCQVLFSGWPGSSKPMYALALIFVFALAVLAEGLSRCTDTKPSGANKVASCMYGAGLHAVSSGFRYLVMLSVMSFNGGVFLAAVFGHAFGFSLFRGRACGSRNAPSDLPTRK